MIGTAIAAARSATALQAARLGISAERLATRLGFAQLSIKEPQQDTSDLALQAVQNLVEQGFDLNAIQCLCVVTQNPDAGGIPHVSALLHGRLGLGQGVAAFDLGLGCSGFVYGIAIAKAFMQLHGFTRGLLITADPYSKIVDGDDPQTALIFGDAAAAVELSANYIWRIGETDFGTAGQHSGALRLLDSGKLAMNGRQIARVCATSIPDSIAASVRLNGLTLDDIDEVLLHQGSRYIVETIGAALGVAHKTPFFAGEYGNLVSSSIPIALARHVSPNSECIAVSGFGVGLSWASTVLTRAMSDERSKAIA
jgi:3-oxoacyl-[acyl-carrier-protein] synthase III